VRRPGLSTPVTRLTTTISTVGCFRPSRRRARRNGVLTTVAMLAEPTSAPVVTCATTRRSSMNNTPPPGGQARLAARRRPGSRPSGRPPRLRAGGAQQAGALLGHQPAHERASAPACGRAPGRGLRQPGGRPTIGPCPPAPLPPLPTWRSRYSMVTEGALMLYRASSARSCFRKLASLLRYAGDVGCRGEGVLRCVALRAGCGRWCTCATLRPALI
jgi:hypothetical protein